MNRHASRGLLLLVAASASFTFAQTPSKSDQPASSRKPAVVIKLEAPIERLAPAEQVEVRKYETDLTKAGLSSAEVSLLIDDEVQLRLAVRKASGAVRVDAGASAPPSCNDAHVESGAPGHGMGPYVKTLLAQGLRGRELADAIHAERALRRSAKGHRNPDDGRRQAAGSDGSDVVRKPGGDGPRAGGPDGARNKPHPADHPGKGRPASTPDDPAPPAREKPRAKDEGPGHGRGGNANKAGGKSRGKGDPEDG